MRRMLAILLLLSSGAAAGGDEEEDLWRIDCDWLKRYVASWKDMPEEQRNGLISTWARHVSADSRAAAAFLLGRCDHLESKKLIRDLLDDPDVIVRRVAAGSWFGGEALQEHIAALYGYLDELSAEARARELAEEIRNADMETRYRATRDLIALGRAAAWELRQLCNDRDESVRMSAVYARQEVERLHANVPPAWAREVKKRLEEPVSFEFKDTQFDEAIRELSRTAGVRIRLDGYLGQLDVKISLGVEDVQLSLALERVLGLADAEYDIRDGGISVFGKRFVCGTAAYLLDVRDLAAAGFNPEWGEHLSSNVDDLLNVPAMGTSIRNHEGILEVWVHSSSMHKPLPGWNRAEQVLAHLNRLREERGLPPGAE